MTLNNVIVSTTILLGLVVLAQVFFFQVKEQKLNNIILGFTKWMGNQEKINNALSSATVAVDTELVKNGVFQKSVVADYVWESKQDTAEV